MLANQPTVSHKKIIDYMHQLGYQLNEGGVCLGIAGMAMHAILLDDIKLFNERLKAILKIPLDKFPEKIKKLHQRRLDMVAKERKTLVDQIAKELKIKIDKKSTDTTLFENQLDAAQKKEFYKRLNEKIAGKMKKFTAEEQILLDVYNFFDGVELYLKINEHPELFTKEEKLLTQNLEKTLPLASPVKLDNRIVKTDSFSGIYNKEELAIYFQTLRKALEPACHHPVTMELESGSHAITVGYDPKQKAWIFIDANNLPAQTGIKTENEIAEKIIKAFSKNVYAAFTTKMLVTKENEKATKSYVEAWHKNEEYQKIQSITPEKASRITSNGHSWLLIASREGDIETVNELLKQTDKTSLIEQGDKQNDVYQAVLAAAQFGHVEILQAMNKHGINIEHPTTCAGILSVAAKAGQIKIFEKLCPPLDINAEKKNFESIIQAARNSNQNAIVEKILSYPTLLPTKDNMSIALDLNNFDAVLRMLKKGYDAQLLSQVDIKKVNNNGQGILFFAAHNEDYDLIKKLCSPNGPLDIQVKTIENVNLLHVAAAKGHGFILDYLVKHIDVNSQTRVGNTPLHLAIQFDNDYGVKKLLDLGADPAIENRDSDNALTMAIKLNKLNILKLLLSHDKVDPNKGESWRNPLELAFNLGNFPAVELLLMHNKIKIDYSLFDYKKNNKGQDILYLAALHGKFDLIQKLVPPQGELSINKTTADKSTLLHAAAEGGHLELIKKLASPNGTLDLNAKTAAGDTILHVAVKNGQVDTVKGLLELGLDPTIKNNQGLSAFDMAQENNQPSILKLFSSHQKNDSNTTIQIHQMLGTQPKVSHGNEVRHDDKNDNITKPGTHQKNDAAIENKGIRNNSNDNTFEDASKLRFGQRK